MDARFNGANGAIAADAVLELAGMGINIGDSTDMVIDRFGYWNSGNEDSQDSSSSDIAIEDAGKSKRIGYVRFARQDGLVSGVGVELSYVYMDLLR